MKTWTRRRPSHHPAATDLWPPRTRSPTSAHAPPDTATPAATHHERKPLGRIKSSHHYSHITTLRRCNHLAYWLIRQRLPPHLLQPQNSAARPPECQVLASLHDAWHHVRPVSAGFAPPPGHLLRRIRANSPSRTRRRQPALAPRISPPRASHRPAHLITARTPRIAPRPHSLLKPGAASPGGAPGRAPAANPPPDAILG